MELDRVAEDHLSEARVAVEELEMHDEAARVAHRARHFRRAGKGAHGREHIDERHALQDSATLSIGVRWFLVVLFALLVTLPATASASSALELVRIAKAHELAREDDIALR